MVGASIPKEVKAQALDRSSSRVPVGFRLDNLGFLQFGTQQPTEHFCHNMEALYRNGGLSNWGIDVENW